MQDAKPSSHYLAESDHRRGTAQISADPSSAFDGDGEPRDLDAFITERLDAQHGPSIPRLSGVETVRAELLAEQPLMRIVAHAVRAGASIEPRVAAEGERLSLRDVDGLLARAGRLYGAIIADDNNPIAWSDCCAWTVRKWVRVAREAARS
jgi:hypothetical protein